MSDVRPEVRRGAVAQAQDGQRQFRRRLRVNLNPILSKAIRIRCLKVQVRDCVLEL